MSDRKFGLRRRSGGRHAAPAPASASMPRALSLVRVPRRIAQGGVALGLVLSTGAVVVTAQADERAPTSVVAGGTLARASADAPPTGLAALSRAEAVDDAMAAVDEVSRVRAEATQAAVPDDALAELDAATAELQAAIAEADVEPVVPRERSVSRNAERSDADVTTDDAETPSTLTPDAATVEPETPAPDAPEEPAEAASDADVLTGSTLPDVTDPATAPLREALDRVREAAQVVLTTTEQKRAEAEAARVAQQVAEQAAAAEAERVAAEQAARRAAWKASLQGYQNGKVPAEALCGLSFAAGAQLRCDAAEALEALGAAYAARFGTPLAVTDSYRSYGGQVACRAAKGRLCATPGTSNHGMGVAVDLAGGVQTFGSAQHQWMRENAPAYQWTLPGWAQAGGSKPEPWHWEYVG
ncbi:D-alanyl-D-alanine carboxypeptidase family protein [Cellulomonas xiejunii]|uniref:D-alanyl-D-alanine carboxypeptidase family protein n=1 Tax=Cellulomonas xiejunii TaxID=2968083 RepID=A0ABY5KTP5_9CELL|nr:M15 family metallopeptidase [Cellulomonas xiejunii]MCC2322462.1 D-alanyl-D-alanine carboxypeptidase family protein [Cellulomonas xiejunii]UUI72505.1 D-alanyl-D-alanine carboxypeptidase family protein [Cellulomonas xiejunii]